MSKLEHFDAISKENSDLYKKKNQDYNDSFGETFNRYGLILPVARIDDKLCRLRNLTHNQAQVADESIIDTLRDISNYAIMTIMELEKIKLEKDKIARNVACD